MTSIGDTFKLRILRIANEIEGGIDEVINGRARALRIMQANRRADGLSPVRVWQRDCDCAEWDYIKWIAPTTAALQSLWQDLHENAEGPVSVTVITLQEVEDYQPYHRDRVLEAFENGSNYVV